WVWLLFFFSSRRRHTRFSRDWSSDVCSSDLGRQGLHQCRARRISGRMHQRSRLEQGPVCALAVCSSWSPPDAVRGMRVGHLELAKAGIRTPQRLNRSLVPLSSKKNRTRAENKAASTARAREIEVGAAQFTELPPTRIHRIAVAACAAVTARIERLTLEGVREPTDVGDLDAAHLGQRGTKLLAAWEHVEWRR